MASILLLLTIALQLLVSANQPNVPVSLRNTAISVANTAIEIANKAIKDVEKPALGAVASPTPSISPKPSPSASPVVIASPSPSFSPIATPQPTPVATPSPIIIYKEKIMTPTPIPSELLLKATLVQTPEVALKNGYDQAPYGIYFIEVTLIGEGGDKKIHTHTNGTPDAIEYLVKMDAPDNASYNPNPDIRPIGKGGSPSDANRPYIVNFSYHPQTAGKKTLTFTSGSLTKTIDIDVK